MGSLKAMKVEKVEDTPKQDATQVRHRIVAQLEKANMQLRQIKDQAMIRVKDPQFQTITLSTAGGAFGMASGVVAGSAGGVIPALFTFGLSIPAGAILGGGTGLFLGVGTGALGGGVVGYEVYMYRDQLKDGMLHIKTKALDTAHIAKVNVCNAAGSTTQKLVDGKTFAK